MAQNKYLGPLVTHAAAANGVTLAGQDNPYWNGIQVGVNISALTGTTPSLTVFIEGFDEASGQWYVLLQSAALLTVAFTLLTLYPAAPVAANASANTFLPKTWRIKTVIAGTTPAVTATIGASLMMQ